MFRVVELPQKQHICKVKSLNKGDANSEVTVYYQVRPPPPLLAVPTAAMPAFTPSVSWSAVWTQSPEGAHADGAAGGEWPFAPPHRCFRPSLSPVLLFSDAHGGALLRLPPHQRNSRVRDLNLWLIAVFFNVYMNQIVAVR